MQIHQLIAIEKGLKSAAHTAETEQYHLLQKDVLLAGIEKHYRPKDEENGDRLPSESQSVQVKVEDSLVEVQRRLAALFDVTLARENANCDAAADVVVNGVVLLKDAPVTYLLFLEKQLVNIKTFVAKLPTLPTADRWEFDDNAGLYATPPAETVRTKKVPRLLVKAEATDKHAAQVDVYHEDIVVGYWTTRKFSGALPPSVVRAMAGRVDALVQAVKIARESANAMTAEYTVGANDAVLNYIFTAAS